MSGVARATCHGSPHTSVLQTRPPQPRLPPPVFSTPRDDTGFYLSLITPDALLANFSKRNLGLFQVVLMQGGRWDPFASEIYGGGDKARPTGWHAGVLLAAAGVGGLQLCRPPPSIHGVLSLSQEFVLGEAITLPSAGHCRKVLEHSYPQYPERPFRKKMAGSRWLPIRCANISQKVLETGGCVEKELPLDKNVGLFSLGVRKAAQVSGLPETTKVGQM